MHPGVAVHPLREVASVSTLLPCPFCGAKAVVNYHNTRTAINCENNKCWAQQKGPKGDLEKLCEAWNSRVQIPHPETVTIPRELFERLTEAAEELNNMLYAIEQQPNFCDKKEFPKILAEALKIREALPSTRQPKINEHIHS